MTADLEARAAIAKSQITRLRAAIRLVILCAEQQASPAGHYVVLPSYVEHECRLALRETDQECPSEGRKPAQGTTSAKSAT